MTSRLSPPALPFFALPLSLLLWLAAAAWGQEEADAETTAAQEPQATIVEQVVVTATRSEVSLEAVGSSVTLISIEEIEDRKETSVLDLLRTAPGLMVHQNGGPGTLASASLRGGSAAQTLVLVDGVRVNSNTLASFDLADLRSENVERIEIVRGPQSTLYGSEAMGGVIQIITRRGREGGYQTLAAEAGSESFLLGRLTLGGGGHRADYTASASRESTDGISAASERAGNTEADGYENTSASTRLGFGWGDDNRADLSVRWSDSQTDLDGFEFPVGPVDDPNYFQNREALYASLKVSLPLKPWWTQTLTLSTVDDQLKGTDPDSVFNNFDIQTRSEELTVLADFLPSQNGVLSVGYSYDQRRGRNAETFNEEITLSSFFFQHRWSFGDRFFATVGARHDDHSTFGGELTYRGTLGLRFAGGTTRLHGSYGTGFRAPSLNELYFPFFGNLELRPETSRGFDAGIERRSRGGKAAFDLTYFDNSFEDLIGYDFTTRLANNIRAASTSGLEATVRLTPGPRLDLTATYTYLDSEDETTGEPLRRRPKGRGTLSLAFEPVPNLRGVLTLVSVRDRIESDGSPMDDYDRVDLALGYRFAERYNLYVRVQNLLDEDYEEINGYTSPGLTPVTGLAIDF